VSGRLPDFFVLGHQKCGTTALYFTLKQHPAIFMPEVKEPRYFATDLRSRLPAPSPAAKRLRTLEGYLELFDAARPDQRVGDASPQYLRSRDAPAGIAGLVPEARLIAILREPASFLRSFHQQMVSSKVESERDLGRALRLQEVRREGKSIPRNCHHPQSLQYTDHVHYVEQLQRFEAHFPREQMLVLIYDDFRSDNDATIRQVLRFLGLPAEAQMPVEAVETKPLKAVRSRALHDLAGSLRTARLNAVAAGPVARTLNAMIPSPLRGERVRAQWRRAVYKTPPPPDPALTAELKRRFKPEVERLSTHLGRDLVALWGYDDVT
jgi:hypothetical protein